MDAAGAQKNEAAQTDPAPGGVVARSKRTASWKIAIERVTVLASVFCIVMGVYWFVGNLLSRSDSKPEVIASPNQISDREWHVPGRILLPGKAITNASVLAVVT